MITRARRRRQNVARRWAGWVRFTLKLEETELPEPSWVKMSQVRTLSTERLGRRLATVAAEELDQVIEGLLEVIA
jgi:mRNA-degrading endonuclease toxin of MazEF toxin-antitoxin module